MKPMLAAKASDDLSRLTYPLYTSPKLDGIRCLINSDGRPVSRTLKPIRNRQIQEALSHPSLAGLDGELIVGEPGASDCMRVTNSGVMSADKDLGENWKFYVFDVWARTSIFSRPLVPYNDVLRYLREIDHPNIQVVPQEWTPDWNRLEELEQLYLDSGYEGAMVRAQSGPYKYGRSTVREGHLLKLKRFSQAEAIVLGYVPFYHNANEAEVDNLGYTKRSQVAANKVALDTLGALICSGANPYKPTETTTFRIGTGFTQSERDILWAQRDTLKGRIVTYKFFPTGSKERPRHPVFVSFRDAEDM